MKVTLAVVILLIIGFFAGKITESKLHHCSCPNEDYAVALKGCETVAGDLSEELNDCRWENSNCQYKFNECMGKYQETYDTIFRNRK